MTLPYVSCALFQVPQPGLSSYRAGSLAKRTGYIVQGAIPSSVNGIWIARELRYRVQSLWQKYGWSPMLPPPSRFRVEAVETTHTMTPDMGVGNKLYYRSDYISMRRASTYRRGK
jgi:hypothetical protein